MNKNLKENAKMLGISISYLSDILNGKKGCDEDLMLNIITLYPELDFTLLKPRYILRKETDKCNYMEYRELLAKYGIEKSTLSFQDITKKQLEELLKLIGERNEL